MTDQLPTEIQSTDRRLTAAEFRGLADVPPELEWYANLDSAATQRAYKEAIGDFMRFTGIKRPEDFRNVTRAHVIAWRDDLAKREHERRGQSAASAAPPYGTAWRRCRRSSSICASATPSPTTRSRV